VGRKAVIFGITLLFFGGVAQADNKFTARQQKAVTEKHFLPASATRDPSDLDPLYGVWEFTYTIETTYKEKYTLVTLWQEEDGSCYVLGEAENGDLLLATYDTHDHEYNLLHRQPDVLDFLFYVFNITGDTATGTLYVFSREGGNSLADVTFTGKKIQDIDQPDTSKKCPASLLLIDDQEALDLLREFRDKKLMKTEMGQILVKLYYKYAPAICKTLENKPQLKEKCKKTLRLLKPVIEIMLFK